MDITKCTALKAELANLPEPWIVPVERFFDGNDDLGSIGCNLLEHPGVDVFREVLAGLLSRSDVLAVDAIIHELDPGEDSWPFTDLVLVAGTISVIELREAINTLQPDEVGNAVSFGVSPEIGQRYSAPLLAIWWD